MDTHRIQDMHLLLSETLRLSVEMALAGHFSAHCPQDVQAEPAFGIIPAPAPEWGGLLAAGRSLIRDHSYLSVIPGLAIMLTVLALNLLGDGLRDALDPRLK